MAKHTHCGINDDLEVGPVQTVSLEPTTGGSQWGKTACRTCAGVYQECRFVCGGMFGRQKTPTGEACCSCLDGCTGLCGLLVVGVVSTPLIFVCTLLIASAIIAISAAQGFVMTATLSGCAFTLAPIECTSDVLWPAVGPKQCQARINETHYGPVPDFQDRYVDFLSPPSVQKSVSPRSIGDCRHSTVMSLGLVTFLFDFVAGIVLILSIPCALFLRAFYDDVQAQRAHWRRLDE